MQQVQRPEVQISAVQSDSQSGKESSDKGGSRSLFWLSLGSVVAVAALMYVTLALTWVKFSRAEVFFSESAREMIVFNNMVTPLYHGQPFFDKPILMYWFIIGMFKAMGVSHFAARIPSIVAAVGTLLITGWVTKQLALKGPNPHASTKAALISVMMLASSFMFFGFAYLCMSDMNLVFFDTITMGLIYFGIVKEKQRNLLWWLASVSIGVAFLIKGPVGIVLPGIAAVGYLALTRQLKIIKPMHLVLGGITAALIALPWFYAAYQANGTWALAYFFIRENLIRYAGTMYDTHKPVWFMVQSLALGFLPWSLLVPLALVNQFPTMKEKIAARVDDPKLYMWIWTAVVLGFFSFSRGKCDYYALPVYPAVAALVALYIVDRPNGRVQNIVATILSVLFLAVGLASPLLLTAFARESAGFASVWMLPTALVTGGVVSMVALRKNRLTTAFAALFIGLCLAISGFAVQLFPVVLGARSLDTYAEAIKQTSANTTIGIHAKLHHWVSELTFQSQREPVELGDSKSIAQVFSAGPALILMPEAEYTQALVEIPELRAMPLKVLDRRDVSSKPLNPGYVFKRKGNLYDQTLVLVSN